MSATYVLVSCSANSASRVDDSKRMGSTPTASGSSVPACPTRWAPVRRRSARTTANEVSPAALSTLRTPAANLGLARGGIDRLLGRREDRLHGIVHRLFDLGARGADVPSAAEQRAHGGCVD